MNVATFFDPQGRLNRSQFQMAAIVLVVIGFVLALGGLIPNPMAAMIVGLLTLLLGFVVAYMWVAIWIKRLHNADTTGWMTILIVVGWWILSQIVSSILTTLVAPDMSEAVAEAMMEDGIMAMFEVSAAYAGQLALPSAISGAVISLVYALGLNMVLKNSSEENIYGVAP